MYEYAPARLHTKLVIVDDVTSIGSANLDFRSLYLNLEIMLVIRDAGFRCICAEVTRQYTKSRMVWEALQRSLDEWIQKFNPPLGVFVTFPDAMGRHAADACRRHGLVIPDDAALIVSG
jgi:cardiolipin synthase